MKRIIALCLMFALFRVSAQENRYASSYVCQKGKIHFFSSGAIENIEATSNLSMCVVNTQTKKVSAKVQITTFTFKDKLMQEHFNENYLESDKYPYSTLEMEITDAVDLTKDGTYDVTLKGVLEMHGVKVDREIPAKVVVKNGQLTSATGSFDVKLSDHKIKIPSVVGQNIAETIKVDIDFKFEKYQK